MYTAGKEQTLQASRVEPVTIMGLTGGPDLFGSEFHGAPRCGHFTHTEEPRSRVFR